MMAWIRRRNSTRGREDTLKNHSRRKVGLAILTVLKYGISREYLLRSEFWKKAFLDKAVSSL